MCPEVTGAIGSDGNGPLVIDRLKLTQLGAHVIRAARRLLLGAVERLVNDAICARGRRGPNHRFRALVTCVAFLGAIRRCFGDPATLEYLWWATPFDH